MMEKLASDNDAVVLDRLRLVMFKDEIGAEEREVIRAVVRRRSSRSPARAGGRAEVCKQAATTVGRSRAAHPPAVRDHGHVE